MKLLSNQSTRHASAIATLAAALLFTACPESPAPTSEPVDAGPSLPDASWAFAAGDEIPENATMVSPEEFSRRWLAGELVLTGPKADEEAGARAEAQDEEDRQTIEAYRREFPNMPDLSAPRGEATDPNVRPRGDGNYDISVPIDGAPTTFMLHGDRVRLRVAAEAIRRYRTRDNQYEIYKGLYDSLSPGWRADLQLPPPEETDTLDTTGLLGWTTTIVDNWQDILEFDETPPPVILLPRTCDDDVGAGSGLDHVGQCGFKAGGLVDKYNWPDKEHLSCVKNQGKRGSCVSFAINSLLEELADKRGQAINLSEQALYARAKLKWNEGDNYGDGLNPWFTITSAIKDSYFPPYESAWNYNTSSSRQDIMGKGKDGVLGTKDDVLTGYSNSCVGYNETCSETTHQTQEVCVDIASLHMCGYAYPPGAEQAQAQTGLSLKSAGVELWDPADVDTSLIRMILAVGLVRSPLVWLFDVEASSWDVDANGFVTFTQAGEHARNGNHATHIVGIISNQRLHDFLPNAPDGSGGGYFIVKNSWGPCWGDGGYAYVPYDSVKHYTLSAISGTSLK